MKLLRPLILLLSLSLGLAAAEFHPISSISSSTSGSDLYSVNNLIQGPGSGFEATEPHNSIGGGSTHTWVTNAPNGGSGDYFANGVADPVLIMDLGSDRALSEISTWGYANTNTNGGREFTLRFATSAEGTGGFGSSITYSPSFQAAFSADTRDSNAFSQNVIARYVELTFTDNWRNGQGGTPGGDRVGLGEIAFEDTVPPTDPLLQVDSSLNLELDGSVQTFNLEVSNLGATQNLTLSNLAFSGPNASAFLILSSPGSIVPSDNGVVQFSFNPTGITGPINAALSFTTNDTTQPSVTIALGGFIHDPRISAPGFFDLGNFEVGAGPQNGSLTINNLGGGQTLNITGTELTGSNAANFSITSAPSSIPPLGSDTLTLRFDPEGGEGIFSAQLRITTNDALSPLTVINLNALVGDAIPNSGVRINEFMASNGGTLDDGDGESSDWIELYNAGPGPVDLSGWFLTDSANNPTKWEFPAGTSLAQNAYLIVFASGRDTDDYVDPDGFLHTNFRLTTGGEYLALVEPDGTTIKSEYSPEYPSQFGDISYGTFAEGGASTDLLENSNAEVLIPQNGALGLTWTFPAFDTQSWLRPETGTGVGFDSGPDYLPFIDVNIGTQLSGNGATAYVRIPFEIADTSQISTLNFRVRYDDGYVAYLNGVLITSRNAPVNPDWESSATANANESDNVDEIDISNLISEIQNGTNVLALHSLNRSAGSSDLLIDAELTATSPPTGPLLSGYLASPTPGSENLTGSANPGPEIANVSHTPQQPAETEDVIVTATISPRLVAIGDVDLTYRIQYGTSTTVPMLDNGSGNDASAGDSIYTATIPSSAYGREDMVRWFVTANDTSGSSSRAPLFLDQTGNNQSAEYFGTVTSDPSVSSDLPLLQWFSQNRTAGNTRGGTRASVYFLGRFYDNIFIRQRGQATNGSQSQKFDFNRGDSFYINEEMPSVGEININGRGADSTYVRQPLAFDTHRLAGNESCLSYLWQLRVNGGNDRVGIAIEQVDEDFLDRYGYDEEGDLYKFVQRSNLNPVFFDTITGIEKKTGDESNIDSAVDLVAGLNLPTSAQRRQWVVDNLDLPQVINYLAARSIIQDADDLRKNFYMYLDTRGDERWRLLPWDKDFTFGVVGDGGTFLPHPFFGDEEHKKQNANQWNILYDVIFEEPVTRRIYLRRLRTLMDEVLQPSSTPFNERILENLARDIISPASPPLSSNVGSIDSYLNSRRSVLYNNYPSLIPDAEPSNPDITIAEVEANPNSGNQEEEYIRIHNNEDTEIDLSGWTLEGGVDITFRPGTVIERGSDLYVSPSSKDFLNRATSPTANEEHLVAAPYSGKLSNFSEVLTLRNDDGQVVDSINTPNNPSDAQLYLTISEIMYHPADPNGDAEYLELLNISDSITLDLTGIKFTAGIDFNFPDGSTLAPGERTLVVLDQVAFEAVHGPGLPIAGTFQNNSRLNNGSDRIKLEDASNSTIQEFTYDDQAPWPTGPDGNGFSLVLIDPANSPDLDLAASWKQGLVVGGTPGEPEANGFTGDPNADLDNDGLSALLEYALGTSPTVANTSPFQVATIGTAIQVTTNLSDSAVGIEVTLESSSDLLSWDPANNVPETSRVPNGDGTSKVTYQSASGFVQSEGSLFFRLKVTLQP
ncbi:MAG: lamin tail domain-containing protein [Akkermansiaceae bacterium]|nr:lamin tail domain-containing protein [Akkermansiaceae bacterium]